MKSICQVFLAVLLLSRCTPAGQTSGSAANTPVLRMEDVVYEQEIKTVRIFPGRTPRLPAVTSLGNWDLMLEFDDLANDRDTYNFRIVHCNYNWTPSGLLDLDFLRDYNEFPINNVVFSADTHLNYVHYMCQLPPVKLPGNYVVVVYRGTDKLDLILSRRFMVYDSRISFSQDGKMIGPGSVADLNQQINFTVNHKNYEILNPLLDVHVNLRQNQRWDNYVVDIRPSFIRDIEKELEYRFFDEAKMFKGGNEFRFFDFRSLNYPGRNVDYVDRKNKPYEVFIAKDKSRRGEAYAQYEELDGNFEIANYDFRDLAYTQYAFVNFSLSSPPVNGDVYVTGAFNDWRLDRTNLMSYDSAQRQYKSRILLKQGLYDYQYYLKSPRDPTYYFEGTFFQTENYYEIFVYHRPIQPRADLLIGYVRLAVNPHQQR